MAISEWIIKPIRTLVMIKRRPGFFIISFSFEHSRARLLKFHGGLLDAVHTSHHVGKVTYSISF